MLKMAKKYQLFLVISNVREDPPPPQIIPEVPNTTQPQSQSQTIFLNGFRKDLINTGKSLNKISAVTSKLQIALNDSSDVVNASKEFEQVHNSMISQISTFLNSLQGKKFVLNGSAFEIEDTNKRKPVVGDILTKEEKEEIIQQSAGLESYINSNYSMNRFLTSSLSKALDAN
ncbi:hypothetical protein GPJ56_009334 [Histomonas meleagridis]|nr:hypothetical protein GPJ56_009334 [Histomonas meleagridis]